MTGQWWLDARKPKVEVVAAHLINLAWNGLSQLDKSPSISAKAAKKPRVVVGAGRPVTVAATFRRCQPGGLRPARRVSLAAGPGASAAGRA